MSHFSGVADKFPKIGLEFSRFFYRRFPFKCHKWKYLIVLKKIAHLNGNYLTFSELFKKTHQ